MKQRCPVGPWIRLGECSPKPRRWRSSFAARYGGQAFYAEASAAKGLRSFCPCSVFSMSSIVMMSCELSLSSALRVERSAARDLVHPSAATANAALAGDLDDVPLGTPKEAPALLQTRFYIIDEQSPKTNDPHGQHPKNERIHLCILCALRGFKRDDFPSDAVVRAPTSADKEWITRDFSIGGQGFAQFLPVLSVLGVLCGDDALFNSVDVSFARASAPRG
jgi:hypothetical protein